MQRYYMEIKQIIKTKIKEHQQIIEQIQVDVDKMRNNLVKLKKQTSNQQQLMLESSKLLALKDRMMFHKSAIMTLKDVENEISNYERRKQTEHRKKIRWKRKSWQTWFPQRISDRACARLVFL